MGDNSAEAKAELLTAALTNDNGSDEDDDGELVVVTDWTVKSDGRLTIPSDKREKYGIEEGDDVDAVMLVDN